MAWRNIVFGMLTGVALGACGDAEATDQTDTGMPDTSTPDTSTPDTTEPDTSTPDTTEPDTSTPDTSNPDTSNPDTTEPDTSRDRCACEGGATCLEARDADSCAALGPTCTSPMVLVTACDPGEAMATCERTNTIQYYYWARIDGLLGDAAASCDGTFTVAAVPAGEGAVCSCQRSAASCVQTYGAACDALTCDTPEGKQATACSDVGTVPGRCVTRDGQREVVFYSAAASAEQAELTCHGASANAYYWFPAGL